MHVPTGRQKYFEFYCLDNSLAYGAITSGTYSAVAAGISGSGSVDPTVGVTKARNVTTGFHTWTEDEIAAFRRDTRLGRAQGWHLN
jgi:hypothetical protein